MFWGLTSYGYGQTFTNVCPAANVNLLTHTDSTNKPAGTLVSWHTATPATAANRVPDPTKVMTGTYYVAYYDPTGMCYGATAGPVSVTISNCVAMPVTNVCPATTVNLLVHTDSTNKPAGTVVTWHTGTPATSANRVADPTQVQAGTYYSAYYDPAGMCYGNTAGPVTVTINNCAPTPISNICPATTVNLLTHTDSTNKPAGTVVTWHTGSPATQANQVADPAQVGAGTYYVAYYDPAGMCYGTTAGPVAVTINGCVPISNICPATTVDLLAHTDSTNKPAGTMVTWHTASPATPGNQVADPTKVGAGTYYVAYYDPTGMCYGNTSGSVSVVINACPPIANVCPDSTVNLLARTDSTNKPAGTVVTWHTGTPATLANQVADPTQVGAGTYYVAYYDPAGMCYGNTTGPLTVQITPCNVNQTVALAPKAYLQGALFGVFLPDTLMRDNLRTKGYLPTMSPYPGMGMAGVTDANVSATSVVGASAPAGKDAIVDWVFVELRSAADSVSVVDSRSALIQRDGDIVDVDGVSTLTFTTATPASYFVVVKHRNHLSVMSRDPIALDSVATVVDFRKPTTPTFNLDAGNPINIAQVTVQQGVALWAGNALYVNTSDGKHNVIFQGTDNDVNVIYQQVANSPANTMSSPIFKLKGYYVGDINLNGETIFQGTGNDVEYIYNNVLLNHGGNVSKLPFFKIREQVP